MSTYWRCTANVFYRSQLIEDVNGVLWGARCSEAREREEAPLVLRAARLPTVGYVRVCDQEEGV